MKKALGKLFFFLMGWKYNSDVSLGDTSKSVVIGAPHTSNWDFIFSIFLFWVFDIPIKLFIKDSWTKPWYGFIIKSLGGIGVDRSKHSNLVDYAIELIENEDELFLLNTPEGSRSWAEKWKTGFYHIAKGANVPIMLGYCDYGKKEAGIGKIIYPAGRTQEDVFTEIQEFYKNKQGKFPEKYNPKIF